MINNTIVLTMSLFENHKQVIILTSLTSCKKMMKKKSCLSNITQLEYKVNVKHEYKVELNSLQMIFYIEVIISSPTSEAELFAFNIT
jgi:hypothetical protein